MNEQNNNQPLNNENGQMTNLNVTNNQNVNQSIPQTVSNEQVVQPTSVSPVNNMTNSQNVNQQVVNPTVNSMPISNNGQSQNGIDPSKIQVDPSFANPQIPVENGMPTEQVTPNNLQDNKNQTKSGNTLSLILVFILFIGVGAFIWFLPEIREMKNNKKSVEDNTTTNQEENTQEEQVILSTSVCSKLSNTYTLYYSDDNLKKYSITTTYTKDLDTNYTSCTTAMQSEVKGFTVECNKSTNEVSQTLTYNLEELSSDFISNNNLEFKLNDSVTSIKTKLTNQSYTCSN